MVEIHGVEAAVVSINKQINNFGKATDKLKNKWSYRSAVIPGPTGKCIGEIAKAAEFGYLTNNFGELCLQGTLNLAYKCFTSSGYDAHPFRNLRNSWQTYNR